MIRFLSILLLAAYCSSSSLKIDPAWQCNAICTGSGGKAEFSNDICKCLLNKDMDGTDVVLMQKKAELLGLVVEVIEPPRKIKRESNSTEAIEITSNSSHPVVMDKELADGKADKLGAKAEKLKTEIEKLEADSEKLEDKSEKLEAKPLIKKLETEDKKRDKKLKTAAEEMKASKPKEQTHKNEVSAEEMVGQKPPSKLKQLVAQRRSKEISPQFPDIDLTEANIYNLGQITQHLNRLGAAKDERTRQHEIEIVRGYLKRLTSKTDTTPAPQLFKVRMAPSAERIRTIVRTAKEKRLKLNPQVGATANSTITQERTNQNEEQTAIKEIFHHKKPPHFKVITENPSLIDE